MTNDIINKVSIIMPCYNQGKYIEDAINSVKSQTYHNWECIIVDDGSTDDSYEITKNLIENDERFILIHQENSGVCIARNVAVEKASGEFLLPLDADDMIAPTYIEKALNEFNKNEKCKLVYCNLHFFGARNSDWILPEFKYENLLWMNQIFVTSLIRKSDFLSAGGYNPNMKNGYEDWDFYLSLLKPDDVIIKIPEILFYYRQKPVSRNSEARININELKRQIVKNHIDCYLPFLPDIMNLRESANAWSNASASKLYKICNKILIPIRWIKRTLKL